MTIRGSHDDPITVAPTYTDRVRGSEYSSANYRVVTLAEARTNVVVQSDVITIPGVNQFRWSPTSTATDDGVNAIQIAGVTTGRYVAIPRTSVTRTFEEFGALGDCDPATGAGTDDTVAVQAALTWCNGAGKAVTGTPGKAYKVTAALNTWRSFILGSRGGDKNAWAFYRPAGTAGAFLVCGGLEPAVSRPTVSYGGYGSSQYATIAGFTVLGPTGCGEDCILVPFNFLNGYIDINCFGGFTRNTFRLHRDAPGQDDWVDGYDERQGGYTIWSEIRIDTVLGFWGGQARPVDGIHVRGYSLGTRYGGNTQGHVTHYHLEGAPSGGGIRAWVTGVAEAGTYGVHCYNGTVDVSGFHCEAMTAAGTQIEQGDAVSICAPAQPNVLVSSLGYFHVNGALPQWTYTEKVPTFLGFPLADDFSRDSTNELFLGVPFWSGISGTQNPGSFGAADPLNQILNGDFSRWVGADGTTGNIAGLVGYTTDYAYKGTKCGVGCTDTTRTLGAPNCALLEGDTSNDQEVWANFKLLGLQLQQYHLGCYVFATFKAKTVDPSAVISSGLTPSNSLMGASRHLDAASWRFDAEDDFELFTLSVQVTQDHIDHGASLILFCTSGTSSNSCYVSEVQASLGYTCARNFVRADYHSATSAKLTAGGKLEYYAAAAPTVTTDPVFGQAFVAGDRVMKDSPVVETATGSVSFMTLGWTYDGAAWQPMQVQTGLVGIPS